MQKLSYDADHKTENDGPDDTHGMIPSEDRNSVLLRKGESGDYELRVASRQSAHRKGAPERSLAGISALHGASLLGERPIRFSEEPEGQSAMRYR